MTQTQKIIRAKPGVLELAKQLGNVSQACKVMGYSRDSFYHRWQDAARQFAPFRHHRSSGRRWRRARGW